MKSGIVIVAIYNLLIFLIKRESLLRKTSFMYRNSKTEKKFVFVVTYNVNKC